MTVVLTEEGQYVNLSNIYAAWDMAPTYVELIVNGETLKCPRALWTEATIAAHRHFVQAVAGTFLLHHGKSEGRVWIAREPILAWAIELSGQVKPVTASGVYSSETAAPACLHPDGSVRDDFGLHENLDAWLADVEANEFPAADPKEC